MRNLTRLTLLLTLSSTGILPAGGTARKDPDRQPARVRIDEESRERRERAQRSPEREPEGDDASARREAMREWYGEWTPEYRQHVMSMAARERELNGPMIPGSGIFMPLRVSGNAWSNLGPTDASKQINGSSNLSVRDSGRPVSIIVDPTDANVIYDATAGGGVWKTTNGGTTWTPITEALGSLSIGSLAMDPNNHNTLYLGLGDAFDGTGIGLFKSVDAGATWTGPVFLGSSTRINAIAVSSNDPLVVLAATDAGLYRSTDGGASFSLVTIATGTGVNPACWTLAWAGGTNWALSLEANPSATSGSGQIWYSSNDGATWTQSTGFTQATVGLTRASIASAPSNRTTMYAYAAGYSTWGASDAASDMADMYRSTDGGHTWTSLGTTAGYNSGSKSFTVQYTNTNTDSKYPGNILGGQAWYNQMILVDPTTASTFYVGGNLNLAKVTNATATPSYAVQSNWLAQYSQPYIHADFHAGAFGPDGTLYMGTDGGIFKRTNAATNTWTSSLNVGITSHLIYSVGSSPANTNAVIGGFQDNGTRVRVNATSVFDQTLGGDGFASHIHQVDATKMIGTLYNSRVYKSTDSGQTWTQATGISDANGTIFTMKVVPGLADATGNTLYAITKTKVFKSTNYGTSFTAMGTTGLPTYNATSNPWNIRNIGAAKSNGSVVGLVKNAGEVYITTNGGTSWTKAGALPNSGNSLSYISFGQANSSVVYVASVAPSSTANHIWKSTNGGTSWTALDGSAASPNGIPFGIPINCIVEDPGDSQTLYAGTHLGVYKSQDGGATWFRFGAGLPLVSVTDFYITPTSSLMRVSTFGRGFWEFTTNTGTVSASITAPVSNQTVASGATVNFTGTATETDPASTLSYGWNFGDSTTATGTSASHSWTNATGTNQVYTVTFTATGSTGGSASATRTITVTPAIPLAASIGTPATDVSIASGTQVAFSGSGSGGTAPYTYAWTFGDGGSATGATPNHTFTNLTGTSAGYTVTLTVTDANAATASTTRSVTVAPATLAAKPGESDFNADGKSDVLWHNSTTGQVLVWNMNGSAILSSGVVNTATAPWSIKGIGEVNQDGKSDIIWQNANDGMVYIWTVNGTTMTGGGSPGSAGAPWAILGIGDFNGDGLSDILWRDGSNGRVVQWQLGSATTKTSLDVTTVGLEWQVAAIGDFNGDGKSDILWRNTNTGALFVWCMNGASIASSGTPGTASTDWVVKGTGDFDGDGKSDILWWNATTGEVVIWFMNGTAKTGVGSPGSAPTNWQIKRVGDYDGDGKADILWQNQTDGQVGIWFMNGGTRTSAGFMANVSSDWVIK